MMKHLVKMLAAVLLLMLAAGCQKEALSPLYPSPSIQLDETVQPRAPIDEVFQSLLEDFRAEIQTLIDNGILDGTNGTGILNRLDNIEKKYLKGQKEVALNMLQALINHLGALNAGGVIAPEIYTDLMESVQDIIEVIEYDCSGPATLIALNGLRLNLPPSGYANVPPEVFVVYSTNACADLSISDDPADEEPDGPTLELSCENLDYNYVRVWATTPFAQDWAETRIYVQDNFGVCTGGTSDECAPIPIAHFELAVAITEMYGEVTLEASAFDAGSIDACGTGNLSFLVKKEGDNGDPLPTITLGVEDVGQVGVELWVSDGIHSSMVVTSVFVQDMVAPI